MLLMMMIIMTMLLLPLLLLLLLLHSKTPRFPKYVKIPEPEPEQRVTCDV